MADKRGLAVEMALRGQNDGAFAPAVLPALGAWKPAKDAGPHIPTATVTAATKLDKLPNPRQSHIIPDSCAEPKNQSSIETAYRFGDFGLYPRDGLLKRGAASIALQPKPFDALLCLVRGAAHLVSKQELRQTLWPDVHVSERNLTNLIVGLRRIRGPRIKVDAKSAASANFAIPARVHFSVGVPRNAGNSKEVLLKRTTSLEGLGVSGCRGVARGLGRIPSLLVHRFVELFSCERLAVEQM